MQYFTLPSDRQQFAFYHIVKYLWAKSHILLVRDCVIQNIEYFCENFKKIQDSQQNRHEKNYPIKIQSIKNFIHADWDFIPFSFQ